MSRLPHFLRIVACLGSLILLALVMILITIGRDAAEKIGTAIVMPAGVVWLLLMALTIQLWRPSRGSHSTEARWSSVCCLFAYSFAGSDYVAGSLSRMLESPYVTINPLETDPPDVVIVLGGGGGPGANGRQQGNASGDRLILAAQLYHQHPTTRIICTGQRIESMNSTGVDPAETSREILLRLGIPAASMELTGGRNTSEEMHNLGRKFEGTQLRIGLLTSAWHLLRATRLAKRQGLETIPLPADFRSAAPNQPRTTGQKIEALIPSGSAFASTWWLSKELLGMLLGR